MQIRAGPVDAVPVWCGEGKAETEGETVSRKENTFISYFYIPL